MTDSSIDHITMIGDAAKAATIKIPVNGEFSEAAVAHARQITGTAP